MKPSIQIVFLPAANVWWIVFGTTFQDFQPLGSFATKREAQQVLATWVQAGNSDDRIWGDAA